MLQNKYDGMAFEQEIADAFERHGFNYERSVPHAKPSNGAQGACPDFVVFTKDGIPVLVVEGKAGSANSAHEVVQSEVYAEIVQQMEGNLALYVTPDGTGDRIGERVKEAFRDGIVLDGNETAAEKLALLAELREQGNTAPAMLTTTTEGAVAVAEMFVERAQALEDQRLEASEARLAAAAGEDREPWADTASPPQDSPQSLELAPAENQDFAEQVPTDAEYAIVWEELRDVPEHAATDAAPDHGAMEAAPVEPSLAESHDAGTAVADASPADALASPAVQPTLEVMVDAGAGNLLGSPGMGGSEWRR